MGAVTPAARPTSISDGQDEVFSKSQALVTLIADTLSTPEEITASVNEKAIASDNKSAISLATQSSAN